MEIKLFPDIPDMIERFAKYLVALKEVGPNERARYYETIEETYRLLDGQWLPASGRELRHAPSLVICRNSPMNTRPEDLLTDVCVPLA